LNVEKKSILQVGGSVDKAIKGEYHIDVKAILKEAWALTLASRVAINSGLLFTFSLGLLITFIISAYMGGIEAVYKDQQLGAMLNIIVTLVVYPFLVGVEMMGVFHAVGLKTNAKLVFAFLKRGSWVAICALLSSTIVTLGLSLYVLPGIFLGVALTLVLPLVVEKKMSPLKAIVVSIQSTRHQWFQIFALYFALIILLVISLLPLALTAKSSIGIVGVVFFLFSFTYLAPLFYNVKGILYREIFGMQLIVDSDSDIQGDVKKDSSFSA